MSENNETTKVVYTKQIKNGALKASQMELGASIVGELSDFIDGQYGMIPVISVNGNPVKVFPSGNLKGLSERVARGEFTIGDRISITRLNDYTTKNGRVSSSFNVSKQVTPNTKAVAAASNTMTTTTTDEVKAKIAALKAAASAKTQAN